MTLKISAKSRTENIFMFQRQGIIELHLVWKEINQIDPEKPIGPDVRAAVSAIDLTASLWNHGVIERNVLHQSYWEPFSELYEALSKTEAIVPGYKRTGKSFLSREIKSAYLEMQKYDAETVRKTSLGTS